MNKTYFINLVKNDGSDWCLLYNNDIAYVKGTFDVIAIPPEYEKAEFCVTSEDIDTMLDYDIIETKNA